MSDFSLKLSDDQIGLQSWVHGFAEDVVRPAAEEWDEKEDKKWILTFRILDEYERYPDYN